MPNNVELTTEDTNRPSLLIDPKLSSEYRKIRDVVSERERLIDRERARIGGCVSQVGVKIGGGVYQDGAKIGGEVKQRGAEIGKKRTSP